jgi:hypothetical protein
MRRVALQLALPRELSWRDNDASASTSLHPIHVHESPDGLLLGATDLMPVTELQRVPVRAEDRPEDRPEEPPARMDSVWSVALRTCHAGYHFAACIEYMYGVSAEMPACLTERYQYWLPPMST